MLERLKNFARNHADLPDAHDISPEIFHQLGETGLFGAAHPAAAARASAVIARETGSLGLALACLAQCLIPAVLDRFAGLPAELKAKAAKGENILALAISEPKAGAHPKHLATAATRIPGGWRLDGEKAYVTNGPAASHLAVLAITGTEEGRKAFSFFLAPIPSQGVTAVPQPQTEMLRPAGHCGFLLNNWEVADDALIGTPGKGYEQIALPFRSIEDAASASSLIAILAKANRRMVDSFGPHASDEQLLALGELAGIETCLYALEAPLHACLERWETESSTARLHLVAIYDLVRRGVEILQHNRSDETIHRMAQDVECFLNIARTARQARKLQAGRTYNLSIKSPLDVSKYE